ncbi:magnesium ion transporter [Allomyces javanicus]|nr:magnesium ion transporter [Allomyces javanicus]
MVVSPVSPGNPPTPAAPPSSHHHPDWDSMFRPPATEIVWKCTEFGPTGEVHQPSAPRTDSKRAFCRRNGLQLRDLRKLDPRDVDQYPAILARPGAIVVNLGQVRALIRRDSCTLFDAPSARATPARQALVDALSLRLAARAEKGKDVTMPANEREEHLPYEWVVLETLFQSVLGSLQHDLRRLALPVNKIVNALVQGGTSSTMSSAALDSLDQRRYLSELFVFVQRLSAFEQKVSNMRDVLRELLDNDEDMVDMCLSNDATSTAATVEVDYDDLELLLETYLSNMEEVLDSTATLLQTVTSTERFITLSLDSQRNALLILEIKFAMFGVACTSGALLASLFGMNLNSGLEENPTAFLGVCAVTAILCAGVLGAGVSRMHAVTRGTRSRRRPTLVARAATVPLQAAVDAALRLPPALALADPRLLAALADYHVALAKHTASPSGAAGKVETVKHKGKELDDAALRMVEYHRRRVNEILMHGAAAAASVGVVSAGPSSAAGPSSWPGTSESGVKQAHDGFDGHLPESSSQLHDAHMQNALMRTSTEQYDDDAHRIANADGPSSHVSAATSHSVGSLEAGFSFTHRLYE